jgi:hypothetical protein
MQKEFPALEKYLNAEPKFKIKSAFDDDERGKAPASSIEQKSGRSSLSIDLDEDISGHWIFNTKYTQEEKEILKQFNPNSVAFMNLEQKTALYKKKALKDIDPKNRLYDVLNDKIDETIRKYYSTID